MQTPCHQSPRSTPAKQVGVESQWTSMELFGNVWEPQIIRSTYCTATSLCPFSLPNIQADSFLWLYCQCPTENTLSTSSSATPVSNQEHRLCLDILLGIFLSRFPPLCQATECTYLPAKNNGGSDSTLERMLQLSTSACVIVTEFTLLSGSKSADTRNIFSDCYQGSKAKGHCSKIWNRKVLWLSKPLRVILQKQSSLPASLESKITLLAWKSKYIF